MTTMVETPSGLYVPPTYLHVPEYVTTLGPKVGKVCRLAGFAPDPEQQVALDSIFGKLANGLSSVFEADVFAPRQNIKTGLFKQCVIGWLVVEPQRRIIWSAHEAATSREAHSDLEELLMGTPALAKRVKQITHGDNYRAIIMRNGARCIFKTRTKTGARGLGGRKVILDEGFALVANQMGALLPTLSAQPDPQVLVGSSAGHSDSLVLMDMRDNGRAGRVANQFYMEYCAPAPAVACAMGDRCDHARTTSGCGCDNPDNWLIANSQAKPGGRITVEFIANERQTLPVDEFTRERMSWWDDPRGGVSPIPILQWENSADAAAAPSGCVAVGLDVSPGQGSAAFSVSGLTADEYRYGEVIDFRGGTDWVVARAVELFTNNADATALIYDPTSPAGALEQDLIAAGFVKVKSMDDVIPDDKWRMYAVTTRELTQAVGSLIGDVRSDRFRHRNQDALNLAVAGARPRSLADGIALSRSNSGVDICPLVALTLAKFGFNLFPSTLRAKPKPWVLKR